MSTRILTAPSFIADIKAELRIPTADTTEDQVIFSLLLECAADIYRNNLGKYNWRHMVAPGYVDTSNAKVDGFVIEKVDRLEVDMGSLGYVAIPSIDERVTPSSGTHPTHYQLERGESVTDPTAYLLTTIHFFPQGSYPTGSSRLYFKGLKLPATSSDTAKLEFVEMYPEVKTAVLQRLQIKKGEFDAAQLLAPPKEQSK